MAQIIKSLSLDVSRQNRIRAILAKQFDNGSRFLNIQLNNEGEPIVVAKTSVVLINATRADGASESFWGDVNDDGSVTVPITYWMLELPGRVRCDISVISEQGSKLSSLGFAIEVEKTNGEGDNIGDQEDCGVLAQLISDVKQLEDNFKTIFIRYSANADGENYSEIWSEGMEYIGIANTDIEPVDQSGYVWCRFAVSAEASSIAVDSELSLDSENPIQNKAVTQEFKAFNEAIGDTNRRVSALEQGGVGGGGEYEIPTFNLVELGLPTIVFGGEPAAIETDTTEIITALKKGAVKFIAAVDEGNGVANAEAIMNGIIMPDDSAICSYLYSVANASVTLMFAPGFIAGAFAPLSSGGGGGGVSSWNDLTDKPFGEEADGTVKQLDNKYLEPFEFKVGETDLLPSVTGETLYDDGFGVYAMPTQFTDAEMLNRWHGDAGNPITGNIFVEFDGVVYECAQQRLAALDNAMAVGNCAAFGGVGNNEPFIVSIMSTSIDGQTEVYYWVVAALTDTAPTEHTARVYQTGEKWALKESCLPFNAIAAYIDSYIDEALGGDY